MDTRIIQAAESRRDDMIRFLRDLIALPSASGKEKEAAARVKQEMEKVGFDEIRIDRTGNVLGRVGNGAHVIAMDAALDTAGIGDPDLWPFNPFRGKLENGVVYGRGAAGGKSAMAAMVYGAQIIKDSGSDGDFTLWITGTVQSGNCDGLCWDSILKENVLDAAPEAVVVAAPTNLKICRGHRGRARFVVTARGASCCAAMPERGVNAVNAAAKIAAEIEKLNAALPVDPVLGKATVAVTRIDCETPSTSAVPDKARLFIDRRLTAAETAEKALDEIKTAIERAGLEYGKDADAALDVAHVQFYTGVETQCECRFAGWTLGEDAPLFAAAVESCKAAVENNPQTGVLSISTNGAATMGIHNIPTVCFGPADETFADTVNDQCPVDHLIKAAAFYAAFPAKYLNAVRK